MSERHSTSGRTLEDYERQQRDAELYRYQQGFQAQFFEWSRQAARRNGVIEPIGLDDDIVYLRVITSASREKRTPPKNC